MLRYGRIREQEALTEAMVNDGRSSDRQANPMRGMLEEVSLAHLGRCNAWTAVSRWQPRKVKVTR